VSQDPRVTEFLAALNDADPNAFCNPPGLGGGFRVKHILNGLERGVVDVHSSGLGFCLVQPKNHAVCRECASSKMRSFCTHCRCEMCLWERLCDEHSGPKATPAQIARLRAQIRLFQMGRKPVVTVSLDD
jgi:hypothetical protein